MDIEAQIAHLKTLPLKQLQKIYYDYYNLKPKGFCPGFYIAKIAYRMQELEYGSLPMNVKRLLLRVKLDKTKKKKKSVLPVGTTIIKRYKGQDLRVRVLENGFDLNGKYFSSLSAIAQAVTGNKMSGHAFFNMKLRSLV